MQCLKAFDLKCIYLCKNMQFRPHQREDKSDYVSTQFVTRYASKQYINTYPIHSWAINAVLMRCEAKAPINFISKSGCPNLHALKTNKQYSLKTTTASEVYADVVLLYKLNIFQSRTFFDKNI